jgi:hypothetical protein
MRLIRDEATDFYLLGGEDVKRKQMGESMVVLGAEGMENGIVGDAKVASHEIDQDLRFGHADFGDVSLLLKRCCGREVVYLS